MTPLLHCDQQPTSGFVGGGRNPAALSFRAVISAFRNTDPEGGQSSCRGRVRNIADCIAGIIPAAENAGTDRQPGPAANTKTAGQHLT